MSVVELGPDHLSSAELRGHEVLLRLVAEPPRSDDRGRAALELVAELHCHACASDDRESVAEVDSLLEAWCALGRPRDLWQEIETVVVGHVEQAESVLARGGAG